MNPNQPNDHDRPGLLPRIAHAVRNIFPTNINHNRTQHHPPAQPPQEDVDMMSSSQTLPPHPPAPSTDPPAAAALFDNTNDALPPSFQNEAEDSDESMPSLQSVSSSSDEEMSDTPDEASEDEIVPMLVPRTSRRRARVQSDHDQDRDRRNPAERTGNDHRSRHRSPLLNESHVPSSSSSTLASQLPPPTPSTAQPSTSASPQPPPIGTPRQPTTLPFFNFLLNQPRADNENNGDNTSNNNNNDNNNTPPPLPNNNNNNTSDNANGNAAGRELPRNFVGGIAISIPGPDGRMITTPLPIPDGGNPLHLILASLFGGPGGGPPNPAQQPPDAQPGHPLGNFLAWFNEFMASSINESQREDPERARRLIAGLEVVPTGLVKRLERVGDVGGGEDSGTGGDSLCAICWDSLLAGDVDAWKKAEENRDDTAPVDPASVPLPASGSSTPTEAPTSPPTPSPMTIVSLPCAHVFHASCLLPWFSRPNQTTCPTCRFNIDPEGLTRSPPSSTRDQDRSQDTGNNPANESSRNGGNTNTNANQAPPFIFPPPPQQPEQNNQTGGHDHDHDPHIEDIDVFLDLALDVGFGDDEEFPNEDVLPPLNPFHAGGHNNPHTDDLERLPPLGPIHIAPTGQGSSPSGSTSSLPSDLPGLEPVQPLASSSNSADSTQPNSGRTTGASPSGSTPSTSQPPPPTPPVFFGPPPPPPQQPTTNDNNGPNIHRSRFGLDIIFATDSQGNTRPIAGGFTDGGIPDRGELVDEWVDEQVWVIGGPDGPVNTDGGNGPNRGGRGPAFGLLGPFGIPLFPGIGDHDDPNARSRSTPTTTGAPTTNADPGAGSNETPSAANGAPTTDQADGSPAEGGLSPAELLRSFLLRPPRGGNPPTAGTGPGGIGPGRVGLGPRFGFDRNVIVLGPGFDRPPSNPQQPIPAPAGPSASASNTPNAQANAPPVAEDNNENNTRRSGPIPFPFGPAFNGPNPRTTNPGPQDNAERPNHAAPLLTTLANLFSTLPARPPTAGAAPPPPTPPQWPPNPPPFIFGRTGPQRTRRTTAPLPRERKQWTIPSPPGLTLRQRVERAEREAGLRCDDISCGVGPSDDEPDVDVHIDTVRIHDRSEVSGSSSPANTDKPEPKYACGHKFHPSCLVSAERVAWSSKNEEEGKEVGDGEWVDVECSVCRHAGCVGREVWLEGVRASEI